MIEAALSMTKVQFAHNRWANELLLESLKDMPAEHYSATPCSGNGSIAATVAHLVLVQQSYITWLHDGTSLAEAIGITRKGSDLPDAASALERWKEVDENTNAYLDTLTDEAFVTEKPFALPSGSSSSLPLWQILLQLTTHGVHTRAQIVSAVRSTGIQPAEVSFLRFCMKTREESIAKDEPEA